MQQQSKNREVFEVEKKTTEGHKKILDYFSHANSEITKRYLGLNTEKTAD